MKDEIIIYMNKKHKNFLIRIDLTAYNFINTINNTLKKYVIIEKDDF
jgi:hypothetical protein